MLSRLVEIVLSRIKSSINPRIHLIAGFQMNLLKLASVDRAVMTNDSIRR